jgi:signal transduction histidine kinase
VDKDWVEAGDRRVANYSHVQPGSYTFQVIAANSDGVWNNVGETIRVTVLPPFYRTWWFLSLVTISAIGLALIAYRQRMLQLQRRHQIQQAFSQQLIESQEGERKRISAELHDSIGQSLIVIKNLAFMAANPEDDHQTQERVAQISAVASQAITEVKEISYNLRPYQLDRLGLSRAIKALLTGIADSSDIKFEISIDDLGGLFSKEAEINLYRIIQEGVNNIIKHSAATEARITIKRETTGAVVTIHDNGKGFVPNRAESKDGGFGMIGMSERVRMLGGRHIIQSVPGQGTTITIYIEHENSNGQ